MTRVAYACQDACDPGVDWKLCLIRRSVWRLRTTWASSCGSWKTLVRQEPQVPDRLRQSAQHDPG